MGIPELWDTIRDIEEVKPITQLAEEHYRQHGRPLRIAVDEADWRFNNLTETQVYAICDTSGEQAFQGIEKSMFWRICKLLTRNIQLIFVFDGPGIPWKRGRKGGQRIDYEKHKLLKQVLRCFGIPYQEAPGEAEAECARLQILGLVDAVWSQDSDCPMFGCSLWIHDDRVARVKGDKDRSKENTKKSDTSVRIVRAKDLKDKLNLDREGLVLFAMLVGGDYHPAGLPGCGRMIALEAAREGTLAHGLCLCRNQRDCLEWGFRLAAFFQNKSRARSVTIPTNFPDYKILQKYYRPRVTSDELLKSKGSLNLDTPRPIDERQLLEVTSSRFNIWGRLYMKWVGPVLLTRSLLLRHTSSPREVVHDIKLTNQRTSKSEEVMALRSLERKITFSPFGVTALSREDFEGGEREGMWDGTRDVPFNPAHRVECEYFPAFLLRQVLPADVCDPPPPTPKQESSKRKERSEVDVNGQRPMPPAKKRKEPYNKGQAEARNPPSGIGTSTDRSTVDGKRKTSAVRSTRSRPHTKQQAPTEPLEVIDLSGLDDEPVLRLPPVRQSEVSPSLRESLGGIVDLGSPEPSVDEDEDLTRAIHLSMQSPRLDRNAQGIIALGRASSTPQTPQNVPRLSQNTSLSSSATKMAPSGIDDGTLSASKDHGTHLNELDQIRVARLTHFASSPFAVPRRATEKMRTAQPAIIAAAECIDLTGD